MKKRLSFLGWSSILFTLALIASLKVFAGDNLVVQSRSEFKAKVQGNRSSGEAKLYGLISGPSFLNIVDLAYIVFDSTTGAPKRIMQFSYACSGSDFMIHSLKAFDVMSSNQSRQGQGSVFATGAAAKGVMDSILAMDGVWFAAVKGQDNKIIRARVADDLCRPQMIQAYSFNQLMLSQAPVRYNGTKITVNYQQSRGRLDLNWDIKF